jgi:hypothetical protein
MARIEYPRERELAVLLDHRTMICPFLGGTLQLFVSSSLEAVLVVPFGRERCGLAARPRTAVVSVTENECHLDLQTENG